MILRPQAAILLNVTSLEQCVLIRGRIMVDFSRLSPIGLLA